MVPSAVSAEISSVSRQRFSLDDQRVVARGLKILRQAAKDRFAVVMNFAGLAVHHLRRANHAAAKRRADRLMPQANAENRNLPREALDQRRR